MKENCFFTRIQTGNILRVANSLVWIRLPIKTDYLYNPDKRVVNEKAISYLLKN